MKNKVRIANILLLTVVYCLSISIGSIPIFHSDIQSHKQENHFSAVSSLLSPHALQSETSVDDFNNLLSSGFKNLANELWAIIKTTEQHYETVFSQYTSLSINFLILHRKTDRLFPFHYFW